MIIKVKQPNTAKRTRVDHHQVRAFLRLLERSVAEEGAGMLHRAQELAGEDRKDPRRAKRKLSRSLSINNFPRDHPWTTLPTISTGAELAR